MDALLVLIMLGILPHLHNGVIVPQIAGLFADVQYQSQLSSLVVIWIKLLQPTRPNG